MFVYTQGRVRSGTDSTYPQPDPQQKIHLLLA